MFASSSIPLPFLTAARELKVQSCWSLTTQPLSPSWVDSQKHLLYLASPGDQVSDPDGTPPFQNSRSAVGIIGYSGTVD